MAGEKMIEVLVLDPDVARRDLTLRPAALSAWREARLPANTLLEIRYTDGADGPVVEEFHRLDALPVEIPFNAWVDNHTVGLGEGGAFFEAQVPDPFTQVRLAGLEKGERIQGVLEAEPIAGADLAVLYLRLPGLPYETTLLHEDGRQETYGDRGIRPLTDLPRDAAGLEWSPDGSGLLYNAETGGIVVLGEEVQARWRRNPSDCD